jgi:hypothetical protein
MEKLLRLLLSRGKFVVTYYEVDNYDIVVVQDSYGNALYVEVINSEF